MPEVSEGAIFEVRINLSQSGQRLLNVLHYRLDTEEPMDVLTVCDDMATALLGDEETDSIITAYQAFANVTLDFLYIDIQAIYPTRYAYRRYDMNGAGLRVGDAMPQNVQLSITKRSWAAEVRSGGRMEVAGASTDDVVDGIISVTATNLLTGLGTQLTLPLEIDGPVTSTVTPVIFNRTLPATSRVVEQFTVQPQSRVDRRRTVGRGK